jgi:hypothetical protein
LTESLPAVELGLPYLEYSEQYTFDALQFTPE